MRALVDEARADFTAATVLTYLPILIERTVRARLETTDVTRRPPARLARTGDW